MNQYTYMIGVYNDDMSRTGYLSWLVGHGRDGWHLCARYGNTHVFARKLEQPEQTPPVADSDYIGPGFRPLQEGRVYEKDRAHEVERKPSLASVLHDMRNLDLPALEALQESVQNQITIARMVKAK